MIIVISRIFEYDLTDRLTLYVNKLSSQKPLV